MTYYSVKHVLGIESDTVDGLLTLYMTSIPTLMRILMRY
jgi:hypothetical protein